MEANTEARLEILLNAGCSTGSELWEENSDESRVLDYSTYVLRLPEPSLLRILRFLRYPILVNLKSICPELTELCDLHIRLTDQEFSERPFFKFERCRPEDLDDENGAEIMSARQNACMTYYEPNQSAYLFGGEALGSDEVDPRASFNDLWRLDTATMKWSRVMISSAPYPTQKSHATLVAWKNFLILFGGHRSLRRGVRNHILRELHFFDINTSSWEYVASCGNVPKVAGHSAVVADDLMVVYGGWSDIIIDYTRHIFVMEINEKSWVDIRMQHWEHNGRAEFPSFQANKTKLVLIRKGLLLLTGEAEHSYGESVLIRYDHDFPLISPWQWKTVRTNGRWWRPKKIPKSEEDPTLRGNPECAMPNCQFFQIADVRNSKTIRLVSLGRLQDEYQPMRQTFCDQYESVQTLYREFCRQLRLHLEPEFRRRMAASSNDTCAIFKFRNLMCKIDGCFVEGKTPSANDSHPHSHHVKVCARALPGGEAALPPRFDDVDLYEMRASIRAIINQLHSKYYNSSRMDYLVSRLPMRNGPLKRLFAYVAEIPLNIDYEAFEEFSWSPQPMQYPSPVETFDYCLVGAHHEVIMHSGLVNYNEAMRRMGQTILLTPTSANNL